MDDLAALIGGLDGLSMIIGVLGGFLCALLFSRVDRRGVLKQVSNSLSDEVKASFENVTETIHSSVQTTSAEALRDNQTQFLAVANEKLADQRNMHSQELESKKALIDTQLNQMSETLKAVPTELEKSQKLVGEVMQQSATSLKESNQTFMQQLDDKTEAETNAHIAELEAKKKLIDQHLEQMSDTLKTVPTELEKNQRNVSETIEKSAKGLEESNAAHLQLLQERSENQNKEHIAKLDEKELLISRRLGEMDDKLGKVQALIDEFEKARESKLGALDDQLKSLTATTSSLHKALADNQARGRWGERIAEQILEHLGMHLGRGYEKQAPTPSGERPDFTFQLPNGLKINMDCKFPIENYNKYFNAANESERATYRKNFLRNVEKHVTDVNGRDYINNATVDCVLIFIPNEQIYSFIHQEGSEVIDKALASRVILCSPLTLYIILAVIRQASENFAIEQRSQEVLDVLKGIEKQWSEYTKLMDGMGKNFRTLQGKFEDLTGTRTRQLDRQFARIDSIKSDADNGDARVGLPQLPEETG